MINCVSFLSFSAALCVPEAVGREVRGSEGLDHHARVRRPRKPQAQDHMAQRGEFDMNPKYSMS